MEYFNNDHIMGNSPSFSADLPAQAIPSSKKTKKWKEMTMDALENIGKRQMRDNLKYKNYYRMMKGELSYLSLKDLLPELREIRKINPDFKIPTFLKHYDLLGTIVNTFIGWLDDIEDKYSVVGLGSYEKNAYLETKTDLMHNYIKSEWQYLINMRLVERGLDPNFNDFQTEEERQAYIQQIEQARQALTPPEIQRYVDYDFKTAAVLFGKETLDLDKERFYMGDLDRKNMIDKLLTGKMFRHYHIGFDYYKPEVWSPLNTFYSKTLDSEYPQYGEYVGRVHYYTAGDIINRYGHLLTSKQKQQILGGTNYFENYGGPSGERENFKNQGAYFSNLYKNEVIPFKGAKDYESLLAFQEYTGIPMGEQHRFEDGEEKTKIVPLAPMNGFSGYSNYSTELSDETGIRKDLYQVTEAYWVSYKRVRYINYESESGLVMTRIVTDELLPEFLEENGITKRSITLQKAVKEPEVNTYVEDYIPEVWHGIKISGGELYAEPIYLDCEPLEHQIKEDNGGGLFNFLLPVAGYVGSSLADRVYPYSIIYDASINQMFNLLEKEIGLFVMFDVNMVPSEFKEFGDTGQALAQMMGIAKATGVLGVDASRQNTNNANGGTAFNQYSMYNLSLRDQIIERIQMADWAKSNVYEMVGITPQILGQPQKYTTSEGVKQNANASMIQTQIYFDEFDSFKKRALNIHLAVAQQCQSEGKDIDVFYTKSDLSKSFLSVAGDDIKLWSLGVRAVSNSKKHKKLEEMRQAMLSVNTAGYDALDMARILTCESMQELLASAIESRKHADQVRQETYEQQMSLQQQQQQYEAAIREDQQQHEKDIEAMKGNYKVETERIKAAGIAAGKNSDAQSLEFVKNQSQMAVEQSKIEQTSIDNNRKMDLTESMAKKAAQQRDRELDLKEKQLAQRQRDDQTKRYTSTINKN